VPHAVQIEHDFFRVLGQATHAHGQQAHFHLGGIVRQLVGGGRFVVGQLQPVERRRRRQRAAAILAEGIGLVAGGREQRIAPEFRVIVEVFIAQAHRVDALGQQLHHRVIDQALIAPVVEAAGERAGEPQTGIDLAQ